MADSQDSQQDPVVKLEVRVELWEAQGAADLEIMVDAQDSHEDAAVEVVRGSSRGGGHGRLNAPRRLYMDSTCFELKFTQQSSNQFDCNKNSASWRVSINN